MYPRVPQSVNDRYHAAYNHQSYQNFRLKLERLTTRSHGSSFQAVVMAHLVDSALERCGGADYDGAERRLMRLIAPVSAELVKAALSYLDHFHAGSEKKGTDEEHFQVFARHPEAAYTR